MQTMFAKYGKHMVQIVSYSTDNTKEVEHVAVVKNINNVVEDKLANPGNIRETRVFFISKKRTK